MKKTIALLGATIMTATGAFVFTGCNSASTNEKTVMNVSLNPEVEFVLDENDKVISVNALNEEGNLILSAAVFEGKSADAAVDLFIESSAEMGFLVSGDVSLGDNQIEISFSGDQAAAEKLFNDVKDKAHAKLEEFGVQAQIQLKEGISQEDLQELVAKCAPYLDAAEVQAMEAEELIEIIYESRKETAEFYSQELKNAYYEAKAHAMEKVELDFLKSKVSDAQAILIEAAYDLYTGAVAELEQQRYDLLVSEESDYQTALANFRAAKKEYLNYRNEVANMEQDAVTDAVLEALDIYKQNLDNAEALLEEMASIANKTLDTLKATVKSAYDSFISALEAASVKVDEHIDDISKMQKDEHGKFVDDFENKHGECIDHAKQSWEDMKEGMGRPGGKEDK
ncbi:MAG: hypothetical protein IJ308_05660 [Clostridia bacterium]|nr:hypothetical protein [Clostridia bacterium]